MLTQVSAGFSWGCRQTGGQTGSEFTAHLRQDEAVPSTLTSERRFLPPRSLPDSPVCLLCPPEPPHPDYPSPALTSPAGCLGLSLPLSSIPMGRDQAEPEVPGYEFPARTICNAKLNDRLR